ncbi:MAG: PP2C family protein-serine/threonine phosphatase [Gemmatimonadota bacterium]|nr:MAG: PP2C family protein-serine/threonine phosphatase [Gemmatimonadota bacterium]
MKERITRQDIVLFIAGGVGLLLFAALYGRLSPASAVRMEVDGTGAAAIARTFLEQQGLSFEGYRENVEFSSRGEQIMYLQRSLEPSQMRTIIKEKIPAYYWEITWYKRGDLQFLVGEGENQVEMSGEVKAKVDGTGRLFAFDYSVALADSENVKQLDEADALDLAENFLSVNMNINLSEYKRKEDAAVTHQGETNWDFKWERHDIGIAEERVEIGATLKGDRVITYDFSYKVPVAMETLYSRETETPLPYTVFFILIWVGVGLIFLVLFFMKAIRSELEFKYGLVMGAALAAVHVVAIFPILLRGEWGEGLNYFLKAFFVVIGVSLLWAVCDSLVRSTWREKLAVLDVLGRRRLLTVEFGLATLRGYAFAFVCLGFVTVFCFLGVRTSLVWLTDEGIGDLHTSAFPVVHIVIGALVTAVFLELFFRLFLVSFLRGKIRSTVMIVLLSGLALGFSGFDVFRLAPTWSQTVTMCAVACVFTYAFIRYELTTVIVGSFVIMTLWKAWPMLFTGSGFHFANGLASLAVVAVPAVLAYVSLRTGESVDQIEEYIPPYMARALERERMKQELEVARRVQRSFLPKEYPPIDGLDIAAVCVPANEVGGDYYDFIPLGERGLGVVIGDVSGKGVSAAFYMALTKGILRAEAADHVSPKEILSEVNARFYENSEPDVFISMVYGVLDVERKRFMYARAGHNPVILRRTTEGEPQSFTPPGIALGLDKGKIFKQVIAEDHMDIAPGDVLIFYTDGFTEAINWRKEEFGEERLFDLIDRNRDKSAGEIVSAIEQEIRAFIGDTSQRDDMTMVVLKIL